MTQIRYAQLSWGKTSWAAASILESKQAVKLKSVLLFMHFLVSNFELKGVAGAKKLQISGILSSIKANKLSCVYLGEQTEQTSRENRLPSLIVTFPQPISSWEQNTLHTDRKRICGLEVKVAPDCSFHLFLETWKVNSWRRAITLVRHGTNWSANPLKCPQLSMSLLLCQYSWWPRCSKSRTTDGF